MGVTSNPEIARSEGRFATQVAARLRAEIVSGRFPGGQFLPAVRKVADDYRVNKRTVERAMRVLVSEGLVRSEARRGFRVMARAGDPDRGLPVAYIPHVAAPGQGHWDDFHRQLLVAFQQEAARRGWSLLVVGSADGGGGFGEIQAQLTAARVCGAILETHATPLLQPLAQAGVPTVVVDALSLNPGADGVVQDGEMGGILAAQHLLKLGHERIGWLGPDPHSSTQILDRYCGAAGALAAAGLPLTRGLSVVAPLGDRATSARRAGELLDRSTRPTAILALWQEAAEALITAARERRLVPGRDFEMVGWSTEEHYDEGYAARFAGGPVPPAIVWKISELAEAAVRCLQLRRADPAMTRLQIRVATRLKIQERAKKA